MSLWFEMCGFDTSTSSYNYLMDNNASYLPACEAWLAQEMPTGLDTNVLIPLCTDLAQLEGATNLTVKLILFLLLWRWWVS